jgi:26S proteasome regulatory subunit N2
MFIRLLLISNQVSVLKKLHRVVDVHWAEICDSLPVIEELSEDSRFPGAELAASIASKCFYHLQEYNDSLRLALCAGNYFDICEKGEYIDTLLSKCIDEYMALRLRQESNEESGVVIDPRMENIVEQMFMRCYQDQCYEQAMGVALDTRRIDKVEEVLVQAISANQEDILRYTFNLCQGARNIPSRAFRLSVIDVLVRKYGTLAAPDYANLCSGLQYLNRPADVASTLVNLCHGTPENALQAYQIAFDLQETENQGFVLQVVDGLLASDAGSDDAGGQDESKATGAMEEEAAAPNSAYDERMGKLKRILLEGFDVDLTLNFLFKQSKTDISILKAIKTATEGRSAILHNSTVVCHAYMNSGTTIDAFLRDNLDWLGKASNWSKFTAVASIGVVHKGHVHESMNLLQPYLPQGGISTSPYSESGALYALGLIHANKGGNGDSKTISYLCDALRNAGNNEIVQHGACLGIGLAAMATGSEAIFEELKNTTFTDSASAGEGAALAIGLLLLGQSDSAVAQNSIPDLLNYAHDTDHEKIIRGLALAIAMMVYGKEEGADVIIEQLARDRDPIIRYGAMYAVAMAYCGTGDNGAIRRLLHVAVSDVSDDVRRAAITCLGFVLFRRHEEVPKLVSLLAESFNPHVRYGACMAVGISCVGTAFKDAIDLLQPMLQDQVDFVRQGACMALAMVLMQISEARSPAVKKLREHLHSVINDKHQTVMSKSGAILASGILDAGGRNVVVSLQSRAGFMKMGAVVGMVLFLQYWYWYPLKLFLSLAFSPTMMIGLNQDFDMPKNFSVKCAAPPSMFAYPKTEEKKEEKKEKVVTAVLSTTAKTRAREARKEARKLGRQLSNSSTGGMDSPGKPAPDGPPLERAPSLDRVASLERVASHLSTTSYLSVEVRITLLCRVGYNVFSCSVYIM